MDSTWKQGKRLGRPKTVVDIRVLRWSLTILRSANELPECDADYGAFVKQWLRFS